MWSPGAARAAGVALAALLSILAWWWWQGNPRPVTAAGVPESEVLVTGQPITGNPGSAETLTSITVHVVGRVRKPGIFTLPVGSRVADAIERAGGLAAGANGVHINLARVLSDGEQIRVRRGGVSQGAGLGVGNDLDSSGSTGLINLNTASATDLEQLPGIGPVLAARIVSWRETNGRFAQVDILGEVSGIGPVVLENLRPLVTV